MAASPPPVLPDPRLAAGVARLAARHTGRFSPETVQRLPADAHRRPAATARVRTHPVRPAERFTAERPEAPARIRKTPRTRRPRVLFVCSHGAGRSRPAAALPAHRAVGRVVVSSAGTHPGAAVDPGLAQVLVEAGIDPAGAFPEPPTDEAIQAADVVVTTGRGDACPVFPGRRYLD